MQKHPRQVFSIVEDGLGLSLAHVFRENNQLYIDIAESIWLLTPIYSEDDSGPAPEIPVDVKELDELTSPHFLNMVLSTADHLPIYRHI